MWAYFKERESANGDVDESMVRKNIYLIVNCGSFSYAAIPKLYDSIIGVTGTLRTLSEGQKTILEDIYDVKHKTFMPSVYSDRQLQFNYNVTGPDGPFKVFKKVDFHSEIRKEIDRRRKNANPDLKLLRPVLVFFPDADALISFRTSQFMRDIHNDVGEMNENLSATERTNKIGQAVNPGSITLLTREFGRGIDFVSYDDEVDRAGGVHVISTFVSLELSEEVQIKGRTARQGKHGSYSMVLCEEELEELKLSAQDLESIRTGGAGYEFISGKRHEAFNNMYLNAQVFVDAKADMHRESQEFMQHLYSGNIKEVKKFIAERNFCNISTSSEVSYTLCLIDATGSMGGVIDSTKTCVSVMFERAHAVLNSQGVTGNFQLMVAVYRNYQCGPNLLLEQSQWASEPNDLTEFISKINASGGSNTNGYKAVEIGFELANRMHQKLVDSSEGVLNQVILIGDMPPNTPADVTHNRQSFSDSVWRVAGYGEKTDTDKEMQKLKENNIPVHTVWVPSYFGDNTEQAYLKIARTTNPEEPVCKELDVQPGKGGAELLTEIFTKSVFDSFRGFCSKQQISDLKKGYDTQFG